ncbi:MAG: membrane protein insertion efficiency factor YidD [Bacillota bacterium]
MPVTEIWRKHVLVLAARVEMAARWIVVGLIWLYRVLVSPVLPGTCRFQPSCSVYAEQAVKRHGLIRGGVLAGRRLFRCHPWHPGGYDPVP